MRQVIDSEVGERTMAIRFCGPGDGQGRDKFQSLANLLLVFSILNQLHNDKARDGRYFIKAAEPIDSGSIATLNVYEDVGIQQPRPVARPTPSCIYWQWPGKPESR